MGHRLVHGGHSILQVGVGGPSLCAGPTLGSGAPTEELRYSDGHYAAVHRYQQSTPAQAAGLFWASDLVLADGGADRPAFAPRAGMENVTWDNDWECLFQ